MEERGYYEVAMRAADDGNLLAIATADAIQAQGDAVLVGQVKALCTALEAVLLNQAQLRAELDALLERMGNVEDVVETLGDEDA